MNFSSKKKPNYVCGLMCLKILFKITVQKKIFKRSGNSTIFSEKNAFSVLYKIKPNSGLNF